MAIVPDATRFFDPGPAPSQPISVELKRVPGQDKEEWFLTKQIAYRARQFELRGEPPIVVPRDAVDFRTDLTSVPTMFTWLVPRTGRHLPAALVHDALTPPFRGRDSNGDPLPDWIGPANVSQLEADCVFREAMADLGTPFLRRWMVWSAVSLPTAWHTNKVRALLGFLSLAVIAAMGVFATLDLIDAGSWLPWMRERPWWLELFWGAVMAVLIPLVLSLVWPPGTKKAGAIVGIALAVLLHVTVMVALVTAIYLAAEYLVDRFAP